MKTNTFKQCPRCGTQVNLERRAADPKGALFYPRHRAALTVVGTCPLSFQPVEGHQKTPKASA